MELTFLGTSSAMPTRTRNVSALALRQDQGRAWTLVDCGEATQHQLLRTPLSVHDLQAIFITHVHGDHSYGLPGLLASASMLGRSAPLTIVAPEGIQEWLEVTLRTTQLYLPYALHFIATESLTSLEAGSVIVEAFALSHRVPSWGYRFTQSHRVMKLDTARLAQAGVPRGPLWGRLLAGQAVEHDGRTYRRENFLLPAPPARRIVVAGDNDQPELLASACEDAQLLVHEATYTREVQQKMGDTRGHSNAAQVAQFAQSAGLPNLILTHFSPRYQEGPAGPGSLADVRQEAERVYQGQLFLARDFARYRLEKDGAVSEIGQARSPRPAG